MPKFQPTAFVIIDPKLNAPIGYAAVFPDGSVAVHRPVPGRGTVREWWDSIDACRLLYQEQNKLTFKRIHHEPPGRAGRPAPPARLQNTPVVTNPKPSRNQN